VPSVVRVQPPASLDVVEGTVRRELDAQERRVDAADTRAGLILGFAGIVVTVGGGGWLPLALTAQLLAGLAAAAALTALAPRTLSGLDVRALRALLDTDPVGARLTLLRTQLTRHAEQRARLAAKLARLRLATRLLMAALAFATLAAIVEGTTP
jgi:hypothetical protein